MKLCVDVTEVLECGSVGELGREECEKREEVPPTLRWGLEREVRGLEGSLPFLAFLSYLVGTSIYHNWHNQIRKIVFRFCWIVLGIVLGLVLGIVLGIVSPVLSGVKDVHVILFLQGTWDYTTMCWGDWRCTRGRPFQDLENVCSILTGWWVKQ